MARATHLEQDVQHITLHLIKTACTFSCTRLGLEPAIQATTSAIPYVWKVLKKICNLWNLWSLVVISMLLNLSWRPSGTNFRTSWCFDAQQILCFDIAVPYWAWLAIARLEHDLLSHLSPAQWPTERLGESCAFSRVFSVIWSRVRFLLCSLSNWNCSFKVKHDGHCCWLWRVTPLKKFPACSQTRAHARTSKWITAPP